MNDEFDKISRKKFGGREKEHGDKVEGAQWIVWSLDNEVVQARKATSKERLNRLRERISSTSDHGASVMCRVSSH